MITNTIEGENRQTYYTNSSQIGTASGCVFLDAFTKSLQGGESGSSKDIVSASSLLSLEIYTKSGETLAFSLNSSNYIDDAGDPDGDKYFDDKENIINAIKDEYQKLVDSGFTTATITDSEISEMAEVFSKVSGFTHYNNQDYYGENNLGRYELSSGMVVDMMHQEIVMTSAYQQSSGNGTPDNWTEKNPLSSLAGFSEFTNAGFDSIIDLPDGTSVDDDPSSGGDTGSTGGTGSTGDTGSTGGTGSTGDTDSKYNIEDDAVIKALFKLLSENQQGVGYGSAAETDFKDLVIDFNKEIQKKDTVTEVKKYYDSVMPYIAELTSLLEEPTTAVNIFKSIDVVFDASFTKENYSVIDSGDQETNKELFDMRGQIDYYLNKMISLKTEMDKYNDENPLDPDSTEVDPIWEAKLDKMHSYIEEFFGDYGPVGVVDFMKSKLDPVEEPTGDSGEIGPSEGLIGDLYKIITSYPNGIPIDSETQRDLFVGVREFQDTVYNLKISDYAIDKIKEEFDSAMPYLLEAISKLNDTEAVEKNLEIINDTFKSTFLESDGSVPEEYIKEIHDMISEQRGGMNKALENIKYYNQRLDQAVVNNEPASSVESYTNAIYDQIAKFEQATGVISYETALNKFREDAKSSESA